MKRLVVATFWSALSCLALRASGCTGGSLSLGDALTPVAVDLIAVGATACAAPGFAHPNVCCQGATCGTYPASPFAPCPPSYALYPDPRTCCALYDPSMCLLGFSSPVATADCGYACSPGTFESDAGSCCTSGATSCSPRGMASGCAACPEGFAVPDGGPELCFGVDPNEGTEWFSQALGLAPGASVTAADAGLSGADAEVDASLEGGAPFGG
jgi:hypothetical protein